MVNFWKLSYEAVKEQRDQYETELLQCKSELHHYRAELESYKTNLKQRREERESMISDYQKKLDLVHMLKDEINELKQELHSIYKENEYLLNVIKMSENIEIHSDAYDEMEKGENNKTHHIPHLTDIKTNESIEEPMKFIKRIAKERADDER